MDEKSQIRIFNDYKIRTKWDEDKEDWLFSVVDVIAVLSQSISPSSYWRKLK